MSPKRTFLLFTALYLLSFAVLSGWVLLLLIGLLNPEAMALFNRIALPTLFGSIVALELFKRLARRAEKRLSRRAPGA